MVARPATRIALAANVRAAVDLLRTGREHLSPYEHRIVEAAAGLLMTLAAGLEGRVVMTPPEGS